LQAEAKEKQSAAMLEAATSESQRYSRIAKFYGRVREACVTGEDYPKNAQGFERCLASVMATDPEFRQVTQADAAAMFARAAPPAPMVVLSAAPGTVVVNGSSMLSWSSTSATSCTASGGWTGTKQAAGSEATGSLFNTTAYSLQCAGRGGSAVDLETIVVTAGGGGGGDNEENSGAVTSDCSCCRLWPRS
jgi:hypothetical protein